MHTQDFYDIRAELPDGSCVDFRVLAYDLPQARSRAEKHLIQDRAVAVRSTDWRGQVVFVNRGTD